MIIDETFMWLYVTSKIGSSFIVLGVFNAIVCVISAIVKGINMDDRDWDKAQHTLSKVLYTTLTIAFVSLSVGALLPSKGDAKLYAAYSIGKDVTTSDEAKRLFDTVIKYIEGETETNKK